jgi:RNA polymerase sigma factor (sigma-70 family)
LRSNHGSVLTSDEQAQLCRRSQNDDRYAREQLLRANQGLMHAIARQMLPSTDLSFSDLTQEAAIAMLDAIDRFDASRKVPFPAFAATQIRRALTECIAAARQPGGAPIRYPRHVWKSLAQLSEAEAELARRERPVTTGALSEQMGIPAAAVDQLLLLRMRGRADVELGHDVAGGEDCPLQTTFDRERARTVADAVSSLDARQQQAIAAKFGLGGTRELSDHDLAEQLQCTPKAVSKLHERALAKISQNIKLRQHADDGYA